VDGVIRRRVSNVGNRFSSKESASKPGSNDCFIVKHGFDQIEDIRHFADPDQVFRVDNGTLDILRFLGSENSARTISGKGWVDEMVDRFILQSSVKLGGETFHRADISVSGGYMPGYDNGLGGREFQCR